MMAGTGRFMRNAMTGEVIEIWAAPPPKFDPAEESDATLMAEALAKGKPVSPRTLRAEREATAKEVAINPARFWAERKKQAG
jgi:hypothetical protein